MSLKNNISSTFPGNEADPSFLHANQVRVDRSECRNQITIFEVSLMKEISKLRNSSLVYSN